MRAKKEKNNEAEQKIKRSKETQLKEDNQLTNLFLIPVSLPSGALLNVAGPPKELILSNLKMQI